MENSKFKTLSVSEIVNQNPGSIKIFEKFKIDYCCNGKLSFVEACQKAKVSEEFILEELKGLIAESHNTSIHALELPLDMLANYIVQNHHMYVKKATPQILFLANKVETAHGHRHPELAEIKRQFKILSDELEKHMYKEEIILFPTVINLAKHHNNLSVHHEKFTEGVGFRLMDLIEAMETEHESAGQCLRKMREASNEYSLPPEACNSYRLLYERLQEFEEDLHTHIHLENNILFPEALELEARLASDSACLL